MKLTQVETFLVVADELHFRRAADRLHTQASTVSMLIRDLERELGAVLFDRNSRNVRLTDAGTVFRDRAETIMAEIARAKRETKNADGAPTIRIGLHDEGAAELNPVIVGLWRQRFPAGHVDMQEVSYDSLLDGLLDHSLDCLIVAAVPGLIDPDAPISAAPLFAEQRALAVPANSHLAGEHTVDRATVLGQRFLRVSDDLNASLGRFFLLQDERNTADDATVAARSLVELLHHVGLGDGVMTVSDGVRRFYRRPDVAYVPAPDLDPCPIAAITRADEHRPEVVAFVETAERVVLEHLSLIPTAVSLVDRGDS